MCNCGCNTCETKGPLLTEGKVKSLLSEGLQYHIDKKIPLFETVYRIGSEKHLALIKEARKMYSRNVIDLCEEDEALIKTHLGEFALYEGESVPLDLPMLNEEAYSGFLRNPEDPDSEPFEPTGSVSEFREDLRTLFGKFKGDLKNPEFIKGVAQIMVNWKSLLRSQLDEAKKDIYEAINIKSDIVSLIGNMKSNGLIKSGDIDGNSSKAKGKFKVTIYPTVNTSSTLKDFISELKKHYNFEGTTDAGKKVFKFNRKLYGWLVNNEGLSVDIVLMRKSPLKEDLSEAEFKGKEVSLNKPKRGGPKAYYVYVKDGDKVKKVTFGSGGLRAKIKNKEARNAFAARHNCKNKKDRTKAGYWSCNLPRYASALGLGANMNTFW